MNAQFLEAQPTRSIWDMPQNAMLHEVFQGSFTPTLTIQQSIFGDLKRQMACHEDEFAANMRTLRKHFIFKNGESVGAFLKIHRMLIPILLEATAYLARFFGADVPLALEIESDDGPPTSINALVLFAGTSVDARAALNLFDNAWWMAHMQNANGRIIFDYDLV